MPKSVLIALVFSSCRFLGTEPILTERESGNGARSPSSRGVMAMPNAASSLFDDPGEVLRHGAPDKRVDMPRCLTDLCLNKADRLIDAQIGVFDEVIEQSIDKIEAKTPAEIGPLYRR